MIELAERVAARLIAVPGVVGVVLWAAPARGAADEASDFELGLYFHSTARPSLAALRAVAAALDPAVGAAAVTDYGAWGPWLDGGAHLTVEGRRVDWFYRDIDWVRSAVGYARAGLVHVHDQPGDPYGFHDHAYAAEVALARILQDPDGELAALRGPVADYPEAMRRAIIEQGLSDTSLTLENAATAAARGDVLSVVGAAFRVVASLVQVLHAINACWLVDEQGSVAAAGALPVAPQGFGEVVEGLLAAPGRTVAELTATLEGLRRLVAAVGRSSEAGTVETPPT